MPKLYFSTDVEVEESKEKRPKKIKRLENKRDRRAFNDQLREYEYAFNNKELSNATENES